MPLQIVVSGTGSMGRQVMAAVEAADGLMLAGVLEKFSQDATYALPGGRLVPLRTTPQGLTDLGADVLVDFTQAAWTESLLPVALAAGVRPIVGTTGLPAAWLTEMQHAYAERGLGGVVAPNFALGAVLMMHLATIAAPFFDAAEIIEQHHDGKADAPSGTAISTAHGMRAARTADFQRNQPEREPLPDARGAQHAGVSIHAVRLPGLVAHQTVLFGGVGETLSIRHDSTSRESFMPGVIRAIRAAPALDHLVVGLDRLMGLTD